MLKIRSTLVNFFVFWELGLLILNFAQCIFGLFVLFTYWQDLYWSHETSFHCVGFPQVLHIRDTFLQCNYNILLDLNWCLSISLQCDYYNRKPRELEFHYLRVHTKEKNFMCDKCDFRAIIAAEIDRHVRQVITKCRTPLI